MLITVEIMMLDYSVSKEYTFNLDKKRTRQEVSNGN